MPTEHPTEHPDDNAADAVLALVTRTCVRPPLLGPGVCGSCRGPATRGFRWCYCCRQIASRLDAPPTPTVPISVCCVPGPLHTLLRGYKDQPDQLTRQRFSRLVAQLVGGYLARHRRCLGTVAGGRIDLVCCVPASHRSVGTPLEQIVRDLADRGVLGSGLHFQAGLLRRGDGELGHLRPSPEGYVVAPDRSGAVRDRGVLLLDDTMTTGARLQSAAVALRRVGASAVVGVAVGRAVRPVVNRQQSAYWAAATAAPFTIDRCCLVRCSSTVAQVLGPDPATGAPSP